MITTVIRTIGRPTLKKAIESALREGFDVNVVSDGVPLDFKNLPKEPSYHIIPKWGHYGFMALNVGVAYTETEYLNLLDDDDEFIEGAGDYMRNKVKSYPDVDIWIPGLLFQDGMKLCMNGEKGVAVGNVACPTFKRTVFIEHMLNAHEGHDYQDAFHVIECFRGGKLIAWYEKELIHVRPELEGTNGRGK